MLPSATLFPLGPVLLLIHHEGAGFICRIELEDGVRIYIVFLFIGCICSGGSDVAFGGFSNIIFSRACAAFDTS